MTFLLEIGLDHKYHKDHKQIQRNTTLLFS
jgi:hypothetical protein